MRKMRVRGGKGELKGIDLHYAYIPVPHTKCIYYVSRACSNEKFSK